MEKKEKEGKERKVGDRVEGEGRREGIGCIFNHEEYCVMFFTVLYNYI